MAAKKPEVPPPVASPDLPDDEDNMDDLDDLLDDFQRTTLPPKKPEPYLDPQEPQTGQPSSKGDEPNEDATAKELEQGMAQLLAGFGESPEFAEDFRKLMASMHGDHAAADPVSSRARNSSKPPPIPKNDAEVAAQVQASVEQTLKELKESNEAADKAPVQHEGGDDVLAQMMKVMASTGTLPDPAGEDDFGQLLLDVMEHLTNKEILYEPMKEMNDGFPEWMAKHEDTEKSEDMKRYQEQQQLVGEIVARFERKEYSDENAEDREYIVERMQKMQAAGSPPPDMVGDMGEAKAIFDGVDQGCPQQ